MSERLHRALRLAVRAHDAQDRDGEVAPPYVCHVVEVMLNLRYVGGVDDEDILVVGLLHDTLEQTMASRDEIERDYGPRVARLVAELTRREPSPGEIEGLKRDAVWEVRAASLLDEVRKMSADAQVVKLADRLSNVREAKLAKSAQKFVRYVGQTRRILDVIPRKRNPALWDAILQFIGPPAAGR